MINLSFEIPLIGEREKVIIFHASPGEHNLYW